jgi:putative glutamine amidotransferase
LAETSALFIIQPAAIFSRRVFTLKNTERMVIYKNMKRKPIILTTSFADEDYERKDFEVICVKRPYIECLHAAGAIPLVAPFQSEKDDLRELAEMADGLLLPGGEDVHPEHYGSEDIHENSGPFSHERDEMEIVLARFFIELGKPVFGICRGSQILNVALGGTLYQDIGSELNTSIRHEYDTSISKRERYTEDVHEVHFLDNTALASFFGCEKITTNSLHHQSVKEIAPALCVSALGEDGVIEGIESRDMRVNWILGVQWHPETITKEHPEQTVLFKKFVEAAAR